MENGTFTYQYSAARNKEVERIRQKYLPKEESKLTILKKLDSRVQTAGQVQGLCLGMVGALVFGIGICFGLDVFVGSDWLSVLFCAMGMGVMIPAYPVFRHISKKTREQLTPEILRLSEELIQSSVGFEKNGD